MIISGDATRSHCTRRCPNRTIPAAYPAHLAHPFGPAVRPAPHRPQPLTAPLAPSPENPPCPDALPALRPAPAPSRPPFLPAHPTPAPPDTGDHAAERAVFVRYLKAVINVYAPWTTSPVVNDRERRFAHARITKAQDLLNRLPDRHPSDGPRPPR